MSRRENHIPPQEARVTETIRYQDKPWLTRYDDGVPAHLDYDASCLPEILERTAAKFPDKMALLFQGHRVTYRQLAVLVKRVAGCLVQLGVQPGDRVAILLPNVIPCVVCYYAILRIGAIAVMNNPLYSDRELDHQFNDSGARMLITLDLLANRMIDLRPQTGVRQIIHTSIGDYLPFFKRLLFPLVAKRKKLAATVKPAADVYRWRELLSRSAPEPPALRLNPDDTAMYQYTGGTTGITKGALLTHRNLSCQVQQAAAWFPTFAEGAEIMLGALPFFHVFGLTVAMNFAVYMGWGNVLVPKPQPDALLEAIRKYKATFAPLVPTMYIGMLQHPEIPRTDLTSIKGCFSGSAPLPVEIIRDFEAKTGAVIVEGYGLTEATPVTHANPFGGGKRRVGSIGIPLPDTECRIVDVVDGIVEMPVGDAGELVVRGPQIMRGYLNMPAETEATLRDGWLYTGDIARMDEDGFFYILDRKKDLIISGGFNVYPRDIDEVFYEHPKVQEACSIGIAHPTRGEAVKVFVVLKRGEKATDAELMDWAKERLAKFKWPVEIEFRSSLPKTNVGKILRRDLKAEEQAKSGYNGHAKK
jgi:long-chain acyl-CoA synthetase